jgi:hypothetical protein
MDRETAYDGPQIVGMDLHRSRSVLLRVTPDGQRLDRVRIDNSPTACRRSGPQRLVRAWREPRRTPEQAGVPIIPGSGPGWISGNGRRE